MGVVLEASKTAHRPFGPQDKQECPCHSMGKARDEYGRSVTTKSKELAGRRLYERQGGFTLQDLDYWRRGVGVDAFYSLHYVAGHGEDAFAAWGVFAHGSYWRAAVAADANLRIDFNFA